MLCHFFLRITARQHGGRVDKGNQPSSTPQPPSHTHKHTQIASKTHPTFQLDDPGTTDQQTDELTDRRTDNATDRVCVCN